MLQIMGLGLKTEATPPTRTLDQVQGGINLIQLLEMKVKRTACMLRLTTRLRKRKTALNQAQGRTMAIFQQQREMTQAGSLELQLEMTWKQKRGSCFNSHQIPTILTFRPLSQLLLNGDSALRREKTLVVMAKEPQVQVSTRFHQR
jgi:hypothetical protein